MHIRTPTIRSEILSNAAKRDIWLKLEALQPCGSFKLRGVGAAARAYAQTGARRLVSSSGGNAGIAVAYAGRELSLPALVVVPHSTTARARERIAAHGAQLVVRGDTWAEANGFALGLIERGDAFIHPFDDPFLWDGHASMIDEAAQDAVRIGLERPDAIVLSVGGGGLLCGVIEGLRRVGWEDVPVIAVETEGADAFARSLTAGESVALGAVTSIATSLGARRVCVRALQLAREHAIHSVVVSDRQAVQASLRFLDDHQLLTEPACGAALAVAYGNHAILRPFPRVMVIACGGATVTARQLLDWGAEFGTGD